MDRKKLEMKPYLLKFETCLLVRYLAFATFAILILTWQVLGQFGIAFAIRPASLIRMENAGLPARNEIVVVDPSVSEYWTLLKSVNSHAGVFVLSPQGDGLSQITTILAQHTNVDAIHIISHGAPGQIVLGDGVVSHTELDDQLKHVEAWGRSLTPEADIFIYGCNVAQNSSGRTLLYAMGRASGADIAASVNPTGPLSKNADWVLEFSTGLVADSDLFNQRILSTYDGVLGDNIFIAAEGDYGTAFSHDSALGDLDGDGDLDAVVANSDEPNTVWFNNGDGTFFSYLPAYHETTNSRDIALGDLDGDGDLDVFVANFNEPNLVWFNNGDGTFLVQGTGYGSARSMGVVLGDLDGDGDLDAFVANQNQSNEIWLNNGDGTFTASGQNLGSASSVDLALGDLDGDDDLDAFVVNLGEDNVVWLNNGDATFTYASAYGRLSYSYAIGIGDLDSDGDLDAYVANYGQTNTIYTNDGHAVFAALPENNPHTTSHVLYSSDVAIGDLDDDGDLDAFVASYDHPSTVWLNDGSGYFTLTSEEFSTTPTFGVGLGDLNSDNEPDIFMANFGEPNRVWLNRDTRAPSVSSVAVPNGGIYKIGDILDFMVKFDENIRVSDTSSALSLTLDTSGQVYAVHWSHTSNSIIYRYVILPGDSDPNGLILGDLILFGSTIQDHAGNDANLTLRDIGNTATIEIDGQAPQAPTIPDLQATSDTGVSNFDNITFDITPTFSGVAEPNIQVVLWSSGDGIVGSADADSKGRWTIQSSPLTEGSHRMTASATDPVGNTGMASDVLLLVVDTTPPSAITGTLTIPENSTRGSHVGNVSADDAHGPAAFALLEDSDGRFAIDTTSGLVTVANGVLLDFETAKTHRIVIRARDAAGLATDTPLTVSIIDANDAPIFEGEPSTFAIVGASYVYVPKAIDEDGDTPLIFSILNLPAWLNFDHMNRALTGIPTPVDLGLHPEIIISVTDGNGGYATHDFDLHVYSAPEAVDVYGKPIPGDEVITVEVDSSFTIGASAGSGNYLLELQDKPPGASEPRIESYDEFFKFIPIKQGAFAGDYRLMLTDLTTGLSVPIKVRIPLRVTISQEAFLETDNSQAVTVTGGAVGDRFVFDVLNDTRQPDIHGAIVKVKETIAQDNFEKGNPAVASIEPANVDAITTFQLRGIDEDQPSLTSVVTDWIRVIPVFTYAGTIVSPEGIPIAGARVAAKYLRNHTQEPYETQTDANGFFRLSLPLRYEGYHFFEITAANYLPVFLEGSEIYEPEDTENHAEVILKIPQRIVTGNLIGLGSVEKAVVNACYNDASGFLQATPSLTVTGDGSSSESFELPFEGTFLESLVAVTEDHAAAVTDNDGFGFDFFETGNLMVDLTLLQINNFWMIEEGLADQSHTVLTIKSTDLSETLHEFYLSAKDAEGNPVAIQVLEVTANDLQFTIQGDKKTTIFLHSSQGTIVFTATYYPTGSTLDCPRGSTQVNLKAGAEAIFDCSSNDTFLADEVRVQLPPCGITIDNFACELPTATLEVNTLKANPWTAEVSRMTRATNGSVVEVNLHVGDCHGGLVDLNSYLTDSSFQHLEMTLPFDSKIVGFGDLERGIYRIFQAPNLETFENHEVENILTSRILEVDYLNGSVTFQTNHLSVFGIGQQLLTTDSPIGSEPFEGRNSESAENNSSGGGGGGGCFISDLNSGNKFGLNNLGSVLCTSSRWFLVALAWAIGAFFLFCVYYAKQNHSGFFHNPLLTCWRKK